MLNNKKIIFVSLGFILLACAAYYAKGFFNHEPDAPELSVIRNFYREYLSNYSRETSKKLEGKFSDLPFSQSFIRLREKETHICKEKAGTDICEWGVDGDIYLNAQEVDPQLNYDNSRITFKLVKPQVVEINLNVYPSIKEQEKYYNRTLQFLMILENGKWVVDDLISDEKSARKEMEEGIKFYSKKK